MKVIFTAIFVAILSSCAFSQEFDENTTIDNGNIYNPIACFACHKEQYGDWEISLHAKSHEDFNPLYKKAVSLVSSESRRIYEDVLLECGSCHNPKLEKKFVSESAAIAMMLDIDSAVKNDLKNALEAEHIKSGISCYICHNVDKIDHRKDNTTVGYQLLNWTKGNLIVGPFDLSAQQSIFHAYEKRDFFRENNDLCLACHQGQATKNEFSVYNTGEELNSLNRPKENFISSYEFNATENNETNSTLIGEMNSTENKNFIANSEPIPAAKTEKCIDCHMGSLKKSIIAPQIKRDNMVERDIKSHFFAGPRNSDILKDSVNVNLEQIDAKNATLKVSNLISHAIPSGFSGRSVVLELVFLNGEEIVGKKELEFRSIYKSKFGTETLAYAAKFKSDDTRLQPKEIREYNLTIPDETNSVKATLSYYILAPQLQEVLKLEDEIYTKKYEILTREFKIN